MRVTAYACAMMFLILGTTCACEVACAEEESSPAVYGGKDAAWWITQLSESKGQSAARAALRMMGQAAVPALAKSLREESSTQKRQYILDVFYDGSFDIASVASTFASLLHRDAQIDRIAVLNVIEKSQGIDALLPVVRELLYDKKLARHAAKVYTRSDLNVTLDPELIIHLAASPDSHVRFTALKHLGKSKDLGKGQRVLIESLAGDSDARVARLALMQMARWRPDTVAVETLVRMSSAAHPLLRRFAAKRMLKARGADADTRARVVAMLDDPDSHTRIAAAGALAATKRVESEAVPALLEMLRSADPRARSVATAALGHAGDATAPAVPELLRLAKGRNGSTQARAALRELWPTIQRYIAELLQSLDGSERTWLFQMALQRGIPRSEPHLGTWRRALLRALHDESADRSLRYVTLELLRRISAGDSSSTGALLATAAKGSEALQRDVEAQLQRVGGLPLAILEALQSKDGDVRDYAMSLVERAAVPAPTPAMLMGILDDVDAATRKAIVGKLIGLRRSTARDGRVGMIVTHRPGLALKELDQVDRARVVGEAESMLASLEPRMLVELAANMYGVGVFEEAFVPHLFRALDISDSKVHTNRIVMTLQSFAAVFPRRTHQELQRRLDGDDPIKAARAGRVLAADRAFGTVVGEREKLLRLAARLLDSDNPETREAGTQLTAALGKRGRPMLTRLITMFKKPADVREPHLASVLALIAPDSGLVLEALRERFADRNAPDRLDVPIALQLMGSKGQSAMIELLDPTDPELSTVLSMIVQLGYHRAQAIEAFRALIVDKRLPIEMRGTVESYMYVLENAAK